jgi:hypothetical protein
MGTAPFLVEKWTNRAHVGTYLAHRRGSEADLAGSYRKVTADGRKQELAPHGGPYNYSHRHIVNGGKAGDGLGDAGDLLVF